MVKHAAIASINSGRVNRQNPAKRMRESLQKQIRQIPPDGLAGRWAENDLVSQHETFMRRFRPAAIGNFKPIRLNIAKRGEHHHFRRDFLKAEIARL
jgi:hypothetical protein